MQITSRNETSNGFMPGISGLADVRLSSRNMPRNNNMEDSADTHNPVFLSVPYDDMFLQI